MPGLNFKQHGKRERTFLIIIDGIVRELDSFLCRWRCLICKRTFTYYPPYAQRNNRYVNGDILELTEKYIENENRTYAQSVEHEKMPIGYDGRTFQSDHGHWDTPSPDDPRDERFLVRSTMWKWLSDLGGFKKLLRKALSLIRQKAPSSTIFRDIRPIAVCKYRSQERKKTLDAVRKLLLAEKEFQKIFGQSIFSMV